MCLLSHSKENEGKNEEARNRYSAAIKDFKEAIKLDSDNSLFYTGLGLANAGLGQTKETIEAIKKVKELDAKAAK